MYRWRSSSRIKMINAMLHGGTNAVNLHGWPVCSAITHAKLGHCNTFDDVLRSLYCVTAFKRSVGPMLL